METTRGIGDRAYDFYFRTVEAGVFYLSGTWTVVSSIPEGISQLPASADGLYKTVKLISCVVKGVEFYTGCTHLPATAFCATLLLGIDASRLLSESIPYFLKSGLKQGAKVEELGEGDKVASSFAKDRLCGFYASIVANGGFAALNVASILEVGQNLNLWDLGALAQRMGSFPLLGTMATFSFGSHVYVLVLISLTAFALDSLQKTVSLQTPTLKIQHAAKAAWAMTENALLLYGVHATKEFAILHAAAGFTNYLSGLISTKAMRDSFNVVFT